MAGVVYVEKAKDRLLKMNEQRKVTFILGDAYAWCKLIASKMNRQTISPEDFYEIAEECITEQEQKISRASLRGVARNHFYNKITEVAGFAFAEESEFIVEVQKIAQQKNEISREAIAREPVAFPVVFA